jgi:hypothetical protein
MILLQIDLLFTQKKRICYFLTKLNENDFGICISLLFDWNIVNIRKKELFLTSKKICCLKENNLLFVYEIERKWFIIGISLFFLGNIVDFDKTICLLTSIKIVFTSKVKRFAVYLKEKDVTKSK